MSEGKFDDLPDPLQFFLQASDVIEGDLALCHLVLDARGILDDYLGLRRDHHDARRYRVGDCESDPVAHDGDVGDDDDIILQKGSSAETVVEYPVLPVTERPLLAGGQAGGFQNDLLCPLRCYLADRDVIVKLRSDIVHDDGIHADDALSFIIGSTLHDLGDG